MRAEAPPLEAIGDALLVCASAALGESPFIGAPVALGDATLPEERVVAAWRLDPLGDSPPSRASEPIARRLLAAAASLALHAAIFGTLAWRVAALPDATATVEVELVSESEAAEAPVVAPAPQKPPEPSPPTSEPTATPTATPEPTSAATPEPTPTPMSTQEPIPTPEPTPTPTPTFESIAAPAATPAPPPPRVAPPPRAEPPRKFLAPPRQTAPAKPRPAAAPAAVANAASAVDGAGPSLSAARADYGALAVAQIRAHKFYPAAAQAARETGDVGVLFVVASSGRIASVTITRSSGSTALDQAARTIVGSIELPPPPGGFYSGATRLDFVEP
jgi:protein TonB